jgi:hypothetical protein
MQDLTNLVLTIVHPLVTKPEEVKLEIEESKDFFEYNLVVDSSVLTLFTIHDVETNFFRSIRSNTVNDRTNRFCYCSPFGDKA